MNKNEFQNGDLVRLTYEFKKPDGEGGYDYFLKVMDRSMNLYTICTNDDRLYQIDATNAMPVLSNGDDVLYPLKDVNRSHTAKMYVNSRYLERVEEEPVGEEEVDSDLEGEKNWKDVQEFAKISKNISTITEALESVVESLTKILNSRIR